MRKPTEFTYDPDVTMDLGDLGFQEVTFTVLIDANEQIEVKSLIVHFEGGDLDMSLAMRTIDVFDFWYDKIISAYRAKYKLAG